MEIVDSTTTNEWADQNASSRDDVCGNRSFVPHSRGFRWRSVGFALIAGMDCGCRQPLLTRPSDMTPMQPPDGT